MSSPPCLCRLTSLVESNQQWVTSMSPGSRVAARMTSPSSNWSGSPTPPVGVASRGSHKVELEPETKARSSARMFSTDSATVFHRSHSRVGRPGEEGSPGDPQGNPPSPRDAPGLRRALPGACPRHFTLAGRCSVLAIGVSPSISFATPPKVAPAPSWLKFGVHYQPSRYTLCDVPYCTGMADES